MESLIAESPWYVTAIAIALIAAIVGGMRAFLFTAVCLAGIYYLDLWNFAMVTLTSVLVATIMVVVLAVVVGVWMGRSRMVDRIVRPFLDAGQTMPPFVFLIPMLHLFGPNRFTAMVAASSTPPRSRSRSWRTGSAGSRPRPWRPPSRRAPTSGR